MNRYQFSAFQAWREQVKWVKAVQARGVYLHKLIISKTGSQACLFTQMQGKI